MKGQNSICGSYTIASFACQTILRRICGAGFQPARNSKQKMPNTSLSSGFASIGYNFKIPESPAQAFDQSEKAAPIYFEILKRVPRAVPGPCRRAHALTPQARKYKCRRMPCVIVRSKARAQYGPWHSILSFGPIFALNPMNPRCKGIRCRHSIRLCIATKRYRETVQT